MSLLSLVAVPGFGGNFKRRACRWLVPHKWLLLMSGVGRRTQDTEQPLVSLKVCAALQPDTRCDYPSYAHVPQHHLCSLLRKKDPITSVLPRDSLWEKENKAEAGLHTSLTDPQPLMHILG